MRILFLNPTGRIGGAENALLEIFAGLREQHPSWRLGLVTTSEGPLVVRARALDVDVRVLPFPPALARLGERGALARRPSRTALLLRSSQIAWPTWRYLRRLRGLVRQLSPEIVHTNGLKMHLLGVWARPPRTPLVWHLHDHIARRPLSAALLSRWAPKCSAVVTPSQSVANDVRAFIGAPPPLYTIWNAVDLTRFRPLGDQLNLDEQSNLPRPPEGVVRVGLLATFARWKGHHVFLDAMARLPPSLNVRAYVLGGPVYEADASQVSIEELRGAATRLGLGDRVGFTGLLDDPAPAIRALDILVHASTEPEPFGLAIAEGLACGRAVVVSAAGGAAELVSNRTNALTFPPGDADALAARIHELAADRSLRERLGQAGRVTAERRFGRQRLAAESSDVYERLAPAHGLRVLHVHTGNLYGGVETFLTTLARDAAAAPAMVPSFALCFEGRLSEELRACGCRPHLLGPVRLSRPLTVYRARRTLARLLAKSQVDVVVCHQAWPLAAFGPAIRRAGYPLVLWMHTAGDGRHWLDRWACRTVPDLVVSNSRFTTESVKRWFPGAPVETVYCPLGLSAKPDRTAREAIRRSLGATLDDLVVIQVGRLESGKGIREALEAMATLCDVPGWRFWIVGGPQRASDERYLRELEEIVRRNGLDDRTRFVGERRDVAAILDAADIYCQPNLRPEAFGLSLVEAQAAALPIVTSAFGGALEIVDDTCGVLVPAGDVGGIAAAVRRLLGDAELCTRLGRAGRDRAYALCDLTRQMRRTSEVLSAVASRGPRPLLGPNTSDESLVHP